MGTSDDESTESDGETEPLTNAEVRAKFAAEILLLNLLFNFSAC